MSATKGIDCSMVETPDQISPKGGIKPTVNTLLSPPSPNKRPSLLIPPPPPPPFHPYSSQTINVDRSVIVYSGWKFILFLVFGRMTSNFMC